MDAVLEEAVLSVELPIVRQKLSPEEWINGFREWVKSHEHMNLPILSDEAISRDSIYEDRGL